MFRTVIIALLLNVVRIYGQPEYHIAVGLNYSDFYGYLDVERSVYRELQVEFAEKASIMAGIEVNGDINKTLSYRTGVVYRESGTNGYPMQVMSMPVIMLIRMGGLKFGGGFSPSILLNNFSYDNRQYSFPLHLLVSFKILNRLHVSVGHLRQFNPTITINSANFDSPRMIPEVDKRLHDTYLSLSYSLF